MLPSRSGSACPNTDAEILILGAGVSGLAAAASLREHAIVVERDDRPGGLVRTERFGEYWFDRVIHVLYFPDSRTESRMRALAGEWLEPCPPTAWVETLSGTVRYPFQRNLGGLDRRTIALCVRDLKAALAQEHARPAAHFEERLTRVFGRTMCEIFLFPYNRKLWGRPLNSLAPSGFTWTIAPPKLEEVLAGAAGGRPGWSAYNADGYYPRPPGCASVRGMEVISRALAVHAENLLLRHEVEEIDLVQQVVLARHGRQRHRLRYRTACLSTLPLPETVKRCRQAPPGLVRACRRLRRNRVLSVAVSLRGPRPEGRGHWRYYAGEDLVFTRLVHMHEFDPALAPPEGWGLLAEIVEPAEAPLRPSEETIGRVLADARRVGAFGVDCEVVGARVIVVDPAYVVFTPKSAETVEAACAFLREHRVEPLGRYGRWEYSSMGQAIRDAFRWADEVRTRHCGISQRESGSVPTLRHQRMSAPR